MKGRKEGGKGRGGKGEGGIRIGGGTGQEGREGSKTNRYLKGKIGHHLSTPQKLEP